MGVLITNLSILTAYKDLFHLIVHESKKKKFFNYIQKKICNITN